MLDASYLKSLSNTATFSICLQDKNAKAVQPAKVIAPKEETSDSSESDSDSDSDEVGTTIILLCELHIVQIFNPFSSSYSLKNLLSRQKDL